MFQNDRFSVFKETMLSEVLSKMTVVCSKITILCSKMTDFLCSKMTDFSVFQNDRFSVFQNDRSTIWRFAKMEVPPKSSILIGFSMINHHFGVPPF